MEQLAREWLIIASVCAGMAEAALLEAIKYTKQRAAFGKPLIKFQHNKFQLAELKAEVLSIKTTVDYCVQDYLTSSPRMNPGDSNARVSGLLVPAS